MNEETNTNMIVGVEVGGFVPISTSTPWKNLGLNMNLLKSGRIWKNMEIVARSILVVW